MFSVNQAAPRLIWDLPPGGEGRRDHRSEGRGGSALRPTASFSLAEKEAPEKSIKAVPRGDLEGDERNLSVGGWVAGHPLLLSPSPTGLISPFPPWEKMPY